MNLGEIQGSETPSPQKCLILRTLQEASDALRSEKIRSSRQMLSAE